MADAVLKLAYEVSRVTEEKVSLIEGVMRRTGVLALNARLEAARAGEAGRAFSVVAQEMNGVATDIQNIARQLREAVAANIEQLRRAGSEMHFELRGERLADLALNAVEIIDRNLYERSCDIRWWATDNALVEALANPGPDAAAYAQERLATILRSYTVYLDLWIADREGRIVATGRPDLYRGAAGVNVSDTEWFRRGMGCASGDEFAVCDIIRAPLLGNAAVATYSTAIRADGRRDGEGIGVMGIFFDWAPQAAAIVQGLGLSEDERNASRVMLLGADHQVLAASDGRDILSKKFPIYVGRISAVGTGRATASSPMQGPRDTKPIRGSAGTGASRARWIRSGTRAPDRRIAPDAGGSRYRLICPILSPRMMSRFRFPA